MRVTSIVPVDTRKSKVFLDEDFAFVLYGGELRRYGISEGGQVSEELYRRIVEEVLNKRARERSLYLLQNSDKTESQVRKKLLEEGFPAAVTERTLEFLKHYRYVDDESLAKRYVESKSRVKSRRQMAWELCRKGMDGETVQEALKEGVPEREAISRLIRQKTGGKIPQAQEERRRLYGYLGRKGFSYEDIRSVLGDLEEENWE